MTALARVALESTVITHGLPQPQNLEIARELHAVVRAAGAEPAMIAYLDGCCHVGLNELQLEQLAMLSDVRKCSLRDLPIAGNTKEQACGSSSCSKY